MLAGIAKAIPFPRLLDAGAPSAVNKPGMIAPSRRTYLVVLCALALFAAVRVANTWRVFSGTLDEPIHQIPRGFACPNFRG